MGSSISIKKRTTKQKRMVADKRAESENSDELQILSIWLSSMHDQSNAGSMEPKRRKIRA